MKDRTGERYGNLVVLSFDRTDWVVSKTGKEYTRIYFLCKCDCGNEVSVVTNSLTSGNTKSCGCLRNKLNSSRADDLTGSTFTRLTAIRRLEGLGSWWECLCECGKLKAIQAGKLKNGSVRSCGCLQKEHASATSNKIAKEYRKSLGLDPDIPLTPEREIQRNIFRPLAKEIYKRDSHTCVLCNKSKCMLNAHHIKPWAINPEYRFDKANLITLCVDCHFAVHDGNYNEPPNEAISILLQGYTKVIEDYDAEEVVC